MIPHGGGEIDERTIHGTAPKVGTTCAAHPVHRVTLHASLAPEDPGASEWILGQATAGGLGHSLTKRPAENGEHNYAPHHPLHLPLSYIKQTAQLSRTIDPRSSYN